MELLHEMKQYLKKYQLVRYIHIAYLKYVKNMGINRKKLDADISGRRWKGLNTTEQRTQKIVVSFTSFPERINDVKYTIYSLFNQKCPPDIIVLWLAKEQFPNRQADLPAELAIFEEVGLRIEWYHDCRSYKKIIPSLQKYPNDIIVTVDDDIYYAPECIENLYKCHMRYPLDIVANRVRYIEMNNFGEMLPYETWNFAKTDTVSYRNFFTGAGGVLYPPNSLHKDVLREDVFTKIAPSADDIWLWGMSVLNGREIRVPKEGTEKLKYVSLESELLGKNTLASFNVRGGRNDVQLNELMRCYPEIIKKIRENRV